MSTKTIKFEDGAVQFRQRLIVSILSHRPLIIRNIRPDDLESPGLREHEASFLRLLDRMTNGSAIEINSTGTQLRFKPGVLLGGDIVHTCPVSKSSSDGPNGDNNDDSPILSSSIQCASVGWFLEGILPLAPFGKNPLHLTLEGITDGTCDADPSPDYIATSILPLFLRFGIGADADDGPPPSIRVTKRGAAPLGGGEVVFTCPIVKEIAVPIELTDPGKVKRVRGAVVSCRIPPSSAARTAHAAKGLLHRLLPDVWIHTDTHSSSGKKNRNGAGGCGPSPGLTVCLAAESTEGVIIAAETCLDSSKHSRGSLLPEDLGVKAAAMLLDEVRKGGCVDTGAQSIAFLLMCLGPEDVSRIRVGNLSQYSIVSLRLFKEAFDVEFKIKADNDSKTVLLSCLGTGYRNMARAST